MCLSDLHAGEVFGLHAVFWRRVLSTFAESAKNETIIAKLDGLAANQAAIKADQVTHTTLLADAIRNQPIAVQQQELPAPEVTDADVQAYIRARRPDIELDVFGDPVTPKRKGLVSRILGRG